ncbi:MAG: NADPH-dependent F420 reductase [Methanomassiliicoccales archaeon]|nr:NADPH-dependent F420 reductase [Methanomassiliicoccales archaeon]
MRIGIIGKGQVGSALAKGLRSAGHEIKFGHRDPAESVRDAVSWGEVIVLAVPFSSVKNAVAEIRAGADHKILIDVVNAIGQNMELAVGFNTSEAEELQKMLPKSRVVKAFNTTFAHTMATGKLGNEKITIFTASDDLEAKKIVIGMAKGIGFDAVDAGLLRTARYLEPLGMLMIGLGYGQKMGANIGLRLIRA